MKKLILYVLLASFAFGQGQVLQEASVAQAAAGTAGAGYYISPRRQGGGSGTPGTVTSVTVSPSSTVTGVVTNPTTAVGITLNAISNPSPSGTNLVSGGSVAFVSNLSLTVGAATYVIQGVQYSSPITTLTASAADPTFDRIDIVAVNSSGAAILIEGTPAATPVAPDVDPASQLALTFYILAAGATSIPISVVDIYHNNAEWTMSRTGTTWTLASTNNPYTGSVCIEGTAVTTGNSFTAAAPSDIDLADHDNLIFYIRNKAAWASTRQISIQWLNNSNVAKGGIVTLKNGTYGFNALTNTTAYQQISIPLSAFGANGLAVRKLRFQLAGTGTTIGAYVDDITLQGGLAPVVDNTKMQWRGAYNASNLYNVNDVVISGGLQYVAIAASVGQTPASSTTFWQASTASTGGTVTTVTSTPADGVTLNITSPTGTPNITPDLGNITPDSVTTTGIDSSAGAQVEVANPLAALAINVAKGLNTKTIAVDSTFTFSGTPANSNQGFTLRLTNSDTSNHVITIPSTFDTNAQATVTSFTILAGGVETITWMYDGSTYLGYNIPSPAYSAEVTVASATTTNIGAAASINVAISGTTTITGFGTVAAGTFRQGRFTGVLTFTHNASSLILPNAGSNITTAANDRFGAYSLGSGNWLVLWYQRADGTALQGSGGSGTVTSSSSSSGQWAKFTTATNITGITPGSGVETFVITPSSANLAAALTDETGTGVSVFGTSPTFTTQATIPKIVYTGSVIETTGTGSPESAVSASVGSLFHRTDGGSGTTLYIKESGASTTGWTAVAPGSGAPGGSTTQVQYNNSGSFAGSSAMTFDGTSLTAGGLVSTSSTGLNKIGDTTGLGYWGFGRSATALANWLVGSEPGTTRLAIYNGAYGGTSNLVGFFNATTFTTNTSIEIVSGSNIRIPGGNFLYEGASGAAAPTFTTRSAGTKIVLYDNVGGATVDFGFGIEANAMWQSVANSSTSFKYYAGTTNIATLSGAGLFTLAGVSSSDNFTTTTIGKTLAVKSGSNAKAGTFTLSSGSVTVSNTSVTVNSVIVYTLKTASGARTALDIVPTAASQFVVTGAATDNGTYNFVILEVN